MDSVDQAQQLINQIRLLQRLPADSYIETKRAHVNDTIALLKANEGSHPTLEKELRDLGFTLMQQVKTEDAAIKPITSPETAAWLEQALGGPATALLNVHNADHFKITVDLLPLMTIVGGDWQRLARKFNAAKAQPG